MALLVISRAQMVITEKDVRINANAKTEIVIQSQAFVIAKLVTPEEIVLRSVTLVISARTVNTRAVRTV